jgi:hypothetical protein
MNALSPALPAQVKRVTLWGIQVMRSMLLCVLFLLLGLIVQGNRALLAIGLRFPRLFLVASIPLSHCSLQTCMFGVMRG